MASKRLSVNVTRVCIIQLPHSSRAMPTPTSFGTNARVTSWIWVSDWKSETAKPITSAVTRIGADSLSATSIVWRAMSMMAVSDMARLSVAGDEGLDDEGPAVDHHEQQQLEGERHHHRRHHHHAERHQCTADHQVDDQERDEDDEPDDEGLLELGEHEGRDQGGGRDLVAVGRQVAVGDVRQQLQLVVVGVREHEAA